jgi:CheY-like chemotaxis protein
LKDRGFILHVEDDADDVFFLAEALRRSVIDIPIEVVNDGQAAVEFLLLAGSVADPGASRPSLVLLDLNLPRKTGLEVLKWIRQESVFKTLIVIVLTSSTSEADMEAAYSLGANSYIIKPADAMLLREVAQLIKHYWFGWNQLPPMRSRPGALAHPRVAKG